MDGPEESNAFILLPKTAVCETVMALPLAASREYNIATLVFLNSLNFKIIFFLKLWKITSKPGYM
jgi:hypothetical protein